MVDKCKMPPWQSEANAEPVRMRWCPSISILALHLSIVSERAFCVLLFVIQIICSGPNDTFIYDKYEWTCVTQVTHV